MPGDAAETDDAAGTHRRRAVRVRPGRDSDDLALARIDRRTWDPSNSPAPGPSGETFFDPAAPAAAHLVAEIDGQAVGWLRFTPPTPLPASAHVWAVNGLAVDPPHQGRGVGRALIAVLVDRAGEAGVRKLTLRVLSTNPGAQGFYRTCGFDVEGVLVDEFRIGGAFVDDVLMARHLPGSPPAP